MLRFRVRNVPTKMSKAMGRDERGQGLGPAGRIEKLRQIVTALIRHERLEGNKVHLNEARGYAERLIQEAQRHGDRHKKTMELADYWLLEKDLVHKLFKVLAPRYQNYTSSMTDFHTLPTKYPGGRQFLAILELKGNPYPPVAPHHREMKGTLVNVLVSELRKEVQQERLNKCLAADNPEPVTDSLNETIPEESVDDRLQTIVPKDGTPV